MNTPDPQTHSAPQADQAADNERSSNPGGSHMGHHGHHGGRSGHHSSSPDANSSSPGQLPDAPQ
jgi:hypothetical protein